MTTPPNPNSCKHSLNCVAYVAISDCFLILLRCGRTLPVVAFLPLYTPCAPFRRAVVRAHRGVLCVLFGDVCGFPCALVHSRNVCAPRHRVRRGCVVLPFFSRRFPHVTHHLRWFASLRFNDIILSPGLILHLLVRCFVFFVPASAACLLILSFQLRAHIAVCNLQRCSLVFCLALYFSRVSWCSARCVLPRCAETRNALAWASGTMSREKPSSDGGFLNHVVMMRPPPLLQGVTSPNEC